MPTMPDEFRTDLVYDAQRDAPKLQVLAKKGIRIGTSSWKYEGWLHKVYQKSYGGKRKDFVTKTFDDTCLEEYATNFATVCNDSAYYRFPEHRSLEKISAQLPDDFTMAFKVTDSITQRRFNQGYRKGEYNESFLDARSFTEHFLPPVTEVLGSKLGVIIFEFSPFHFGGSFAKDAYTPQEFIRQLDKFFAGIPHGQHTYAVEIRDAMLISPEYRSYFDVLEHYGVAHTLNEQTWMPELREQLDVPGIYTSSFTVARLLVRPGLSHQGAVEEFAPYDRIKNPMPELRSSFVELIHRSVEEKRECSIYLNNRTEGCAPDTISNVLDLYEQKYPSLITP
ncbi:MAG: DUF72 domain-containing protein [Candidatus Kapaibacterium sp.]|jgi:uncharacterized protein YecE (DUF72 family)